MKYIRTEKGIYEVVGADSCSYLNAPPEMYYITSYNKNILKSKVIAQANTIEELVDGYYWDYGQPFSIQDIHNYEVIKEEWLDYIADCKEDEEDIDPKVIACAFIKTKKGLIFIAKMNTKGELELL